MQRSQMLRGGASRPVLARATAPASPMAHLLDAGVLPQQQMMQAGKLSSHALTSQYLARIRSLCSIGARAYAGIEINPDALKIALEMDRERQGHKVRGPLHGIPIVLRDNIATGDRMKTRTQAPLATQAKANTHTEYSGQDKAKRKPNTCCVHGINALAKPMMANTASSNFCKLMPNSCGAGR